MTGVGVCDVFSFNIIFISSTRFVSSILLAFSKCYCSRKTLGLHMHKPRHLSCCPLSHDTHLATQALGYVRPFLPHTGTNLASQLHGNPGNTIITQNKLVVAQVQIQISHYHLRYNACFFITTICHMTNIM